MIASTQGICRNCRKFAVFNKEDGDGICTKIYGMADYPEGFEVSKTDDEIVLACPYFKEVIKHDKN